MADLSEQELEQLVGRHLAGRLDGQVGRAKRGVMAEIAREARRRVLVRMAWGVGAVAAVVAVAVVPRQFGEERHQAAVVAPAAERPEVAVLAEETQGSIERAVWSSGVRDEGTVYVDDRPVRKLVRQEVERVRWTDASGQWRIEATVPVEDVMLVDLKKY